MVNHELTGDLLQFHLGRAWDVYVDSLTLKENKDASPWENLAQEVRRQVIGQFLFCPEIRQKITEFNGQALDVDGPLENPDWDQDNFAPLPSEKLAAVWVAQALALQAWTRLAFEATNLHKQDMRCRQWVELRQKCSETFQELSPGQASSWRRFIAFRKPFESVEKVRGLLERCQAEFAQLVQEHSFEEAHPDEAALDRRRALERHIERLLAALPPDWPPQRLSDLQDWLTDLEPRRPAFLERLASPRGHMKMWPEWSRWLGKTFPDLTPSGRARLLLVRSVALSLDEPAPPQPLRDGLRVVLQHLLKPTGLDVELICDPEQQPPAWFSKIPDPALETSQPDHMGLAVRSGTGPWACFPMAELRVIVRAESPPTKDKGDAASLEPPSQDAVSPERILERTLAKLDALAKEAEACVTVTQPPAVCFHLSQERAQELETKWLEVKKEAEALSLKTVPERWSFLQTQSWQALELDHESLEAVFCEGADRDEAFLVQAFGLRNSEGETLQKCGVWVSAGPCPAGFADLYALVQNASEPGEEALKQRLSRCPRAWLLDAKAAAAERLYMDFWGPLGDEMRSRGKDDADKFAQRLSFFLERELHWRTFYPEHYHEYPLGWLLVESERGAVSGNVRTVIRPGVKDLEGNLRVQAKVDVD